MYSQTIKEVGQAAESHSSLMDNRVSLAQQVEGNNLTHQVTDTTEEADDYPDQMVEEDDFRSGSKLKSFFAVGAGGLNNTVKLMSRSVTMLTISIVDSNGGLILIDTLQLSLGTHLSSMTVRLRREFSSVGER